MSQLNIKALIPHLIAIAIIVLVNVIYFFPQIEGKEMRQGDVTQSVMMQREIRSYIKEKGTYPTWTNNMFGGMPSYQIYMDSSTPVKYFTRLFGLGTSGAIGIFIMAMIVFYLSLIALNVNRSVSLIGSLFFGLTTNFLILFEAGHASKLYVIISSMFVIAGIVISFGQRKLLGTALFTLGMAMSIYLNHIQMTYYLGITLLFLLVYYIIQHFKEGKILEFVKTSIYLLLGLILAIGANASKLWTTYEYGQETMRGKPILSQADEVSNSEKGGGLAYDYAMQWSNGVGDLVAALIPQFVGGGSIEPVSSDSPFAKAIGRRSGDLQAPTYFGKLPFTSGPSYFGAVVLFLFVFGAFVVKGPIRFYLVSAVLLTFLFSMGKNFNLLNETLFNHFPLFNKFRTPNSVMNLTSLFVVLLATLGLAELVKSEDKQRLLKYSFISFGILGSIALVSWLMGGSMMDFKGSNDAQYGQIADVLVKQRKTMLSSSSMSTLLLLALSFGLVFFYIKNKLNTNVFLILICFIGMFDLFNVGKRYVSHSDFVSKKSKQVDFAPRPVDLSIKQDKDPYYRVYDASINTFNSASSSQQHNTIGGYSAVKLRRIQDIIDRHISKNNMKVLDMLNTKYFIIGEGEKINYQQNPNAAGNAWFVKNVNLVDNPNAEIDSLKNFSVKNDAIVHKEFAEYVKDISPSDSTSTIALTSYDPVLLKYKAKVSSENALAVFSDIWYGPNKGWTAYIDNKPVDFIRTNYLLRGLKIPKGEHEIAFEFKPKSYFLGEKIATFSGWLLVILILAAFYYATFKNNFKTS